MSDHRKPPSEHNARAWDALVQQGAGLTRPASAEEFRDPLAAVDACGWLGDSIRGQRVLCLAAGGGRQSALYAAAGARVTVVDISGEMLALDRAVAAERNLEIRVVQASMEHLPMLDRAEFDLIVQPVSTCYVADVMPVFREVARLLRPEGLYISQHKTPTSLQSTPALEQNAYRLTEPYYCHGSLPAVDPCRLREAGTQEFLHRWEELIGGICRAGFVVEDLMEPMHADPAAAKGTFGHRAQYVAPYVRIKSRRNGERSVDV
jgi:SAM-dependent methyltransferase